jgi:hypothetical protein
LRPLRPQRLAISGVDLLTALATGRQTTRTISHLMLKEDTTMFDSKFDSNPSRRLFSLVRSTKPKLRIALLFMAFLVLGYTRAATQNPVFNINIDQQKLLAGGYPVKTVLEAGGQFWTTPFTQYNPATQMGDGYGEGANGPRSAQRKVFNPNTANYPYLRLNGLDSQSCYECHNSIGSDPGYGPGTPLIRKQPSSVGGSAGSNSNAFINPCFPNPITLFIRQPPHVYGSGYVQTVGDEISTELYNLRKQARINAMSHPGVQQSVVLNDTKHGLGYGTFKTTYTAGSKWKIVNNANSCPPTPCPKRTTALAASGSAALAPAPDICDIGGVMVDGFADDVGMVQGVASDLVVRPFQWKGVSSSLRHFVRDALDFHFSMQAVEKVGSCDCDKDGKTGEVSIGNVSAITAFVGMTRPPQQMVPAGVSNDSVKRGYEIFTGKSSDPTLQSKLVKQMCATCHIPALPIVAQNPQFVIDSPVGNPITNCTTDCPVEATGSYTSLVTPVRTHLQLPALKKIQAGIALNSAALNSAAANTRDCPPADPTYNIPLNSADVPSTALPRLTQTAPFFLPFLPQPPAGAFYVPFFSDLKTHNMGRFLADITAQGADVAGVCIPAPYFLTRPLWGVADTGPWLHDGRATSLLQAIMLHGNSATGSGSEAAPIIDAFEKLSPDDQQAVVNFLLSLRLPLEQDQAATASRQ